MASKALPSQEVLRQLLEYNPDTGVLTWLDRDVRMFPAATPARSTALCRLWNARYAGKEAFTYVGGGYRVGTIEGGCHKAHRVIWKLVTSTDPEQVDHINGCRSDNRWVNMRNVSHAENTRNCKLSVANRSGRTGIYRWAQRGYVYWVALLPENKSSIYFHCIGQAIKARNDAERRLGFHANHGRAA